MDYRKTLNLPKTDFPMKANLAQKEPEILANWEKQNIYKLIQEKSKDKPKYILHDGPPYANGDIHIGHALNKTLKDIIVKFKTMQGFASPYVPGWDCHGLPVEHQLFKELGIHKSQIDRVIFRKKAHNYALKYVEIQKKQFKRLGVFGEWDNPYLTLNHDYEYWIVKSLAELSKKGFVYRGLKPVNWCFNCETALAEAEVEYEDHTSPSIYVKFKVKNSDVLNSTLKRKFNIELPAGKDVYLLVWTTTPWTLLANVAVAVHPNFDYWMQDMGNEIFIIESSRVRVLGSLPENINQLERSIGRTVGVLKGSDFVSLNYDHVFGLRKNCPVVPADYVTRDEGTGLVHIAPGHGQEDHQTGLKHGL